jgi:Na+/H+ antiporter NhaD/arsenite permease-like protein
MSAEASTLVLGMSPQWFAGGLFALTYVLIMTERVNRAIIALLAAGLMIFSGILTQETAGEGVDGNTIGLLIGMMVIVAITKRSGLFQFLAVWSAKRVKADPWGILVMLAIVTAVISAFLDNVGTATLIGDPPNIMIGSAVGLTFNDFVVALAPIIVVILFATLVPIYFIWGRKLHADAHDRERVMRFDEREALTDLPLLRYCLFVLTAVLLAFVFSRPLHLEPATIAMFGAALLLLLDTLRHHRDVHGEKVHSAFTEVEWVTIFFFIGLFIVVHGLDATGVLRDLANWLVGVTGGDMTVTALAILWVSAIASSVVDNIPFVATMIPLIKSMAPTFGGPEGLMPLWWSLSLGACLGGNGTLVGASANLVVAGIAERAGQPIRFIAFTLAAFPLMVLSMVISTVYVYFRFL